MQNWKEFLINSYRHATSPWRSSMLRSMIRDSKVPISILFYHRVANEYPNEWSISEDQFQIQIDWLQENFDLISLEEVQRRIRNGNKRPAISITFDDGYSENCSNALPMLIERNIPFTYFVTTYHTTHNKPFPHDVERNRPLAPNTIESLRSLANARVEIGGHSRTHLDLGKCNDPEQLFDEVIAATREMESMLDCPIRYFAFPYGQKANLNPLAFKLLKEHGYSGVCSAYGGLNNIAEDEFHLQRIHGDPSLARIKNWTKFEPRMNNVVRYDWEEELAKAEQEKCWKDTANSTNTKSKSSNK